MRPTAEIAGCKERIRTNPCNAKAHFDLGLAYYSLGRYREAVKALEKAIGIKPDYFEAHLQLGGAYHSLGRYKMAIRAFKEAIRIKPDNAEAHFGLGIAYYNHYKLGPRWSKFPETMDERVQKALKAVEALQQTIRIKPDYFDAHSMLGLVYAELGRALASLGYYKNAVAPFKEAIRIKPGDGGAHFALGGAYLRIGNQAMALEEYEILKGLDPVKANELFKSIYK